MQAVGVGGMGAQNIRGLEAMRSAVEILRQLSEEARSIAALKNAELDLDRIQLEYFIVQPTKPRSIRIRVVGNSLVGPISWSALKAIITKQRGKGARVSFVSIPSAHQHNSEDADANSHILTDSESGEAIMEAPVGSYQFDLSLEL